ncbi:MAG: hypothetical protein ACLPV8_01985 [Steroidobacteraceae bacterium]
MEALNLPRNWVLGTATYTQQSSLHDPIKYLNSPEWKEPAADPIVDALKAAGDAALRVSEGARVAARAVLNLVATCSTPEIGIEAEEITLEWYKDRNHVAVISVDGASITWAAVDGSAKPVKGKEPFNNQLPSEALKAIRAVG